MTALCPSEYWGSSPLTRGKQDSKLCYPNVSGLIPAHAGKTSSRSPFGCVRCGSSPLTRGKHGPAGRPQQQRRLIPAHAGKTSRPRPSTWRTGAHPRSRGENRRPPVDAREGVGSSPLTRGKRQTFRSGPIRSGLIPAHAGKTPPVVIQARDARAHPRSRGENRAGRMFTPSLAGSSPLTRGKRDRGSAGPRAAGLIPAHAGKTGCPPSPGAARAAHPRSRGENFARVPVGKTCAGSSPLTRGKLAGQHPDHLKTRLIPAHAGKTLPRGSAY